MGGDNKKRPAGGQPAGLRDWDICAVLGGTRTPNIAILAFFAKSHGNDTSSISPGWQLRASQSFDKLEEENGLPLTIRFKL